jgi:membrane-bound lytic murein transglycosylase F
LTVITKTQRLRSAIYLIISLLFIILSSCKKEIAEKKIIQTSFEDLGEIRQRGRIIAVTDFNSTNYFVYKGQPMGFHYELLKSFSDYSGINIEIITENDISRSIEMLNSGEADILAVDLSVDSVRKKYIRFTSPVGRTRQVLVQRKPNRWSSMSQDEIDKSLLRNKLKLSGKTVYAQSGSAAVSSLKELNETIGNRITIIEVPYNADELISLISKREIDYAVCDENIAKVNSGYYAVIDAGTAISPEQDLGWGVRKQNSDKLAGSLNQWITTFGNTNFYSSLYSKYFRNSWSALIVKSDYYTLLTGKVSPYDRLIKSMSDTIQWDWRLLASLIYQESRFKPDVISGQGAVGLMQVMPATGRTFGIDVKTSPENNLKAGVLYIRYLQEFFLTRIPDENERVKFVLAAYNAGEGNIIDAMKLAEKHGKNPLVWDNNVAYYLLKKTEPEYYNDPVVKMGFCRGYESVNFVSEILERYGDYLSIIPAGREQAGL